MSKDKIKWVFVAQLIVVVYSFVGVLSKTASGVLKEEGLLSFKLAMLVVGMFMALGIYAVIWQIILKHMDLSIAYANKGINLFWTMVWSVLFFKESISFQNVLGTIVIIIGILVVANSE